MLKVIEYIYITRAISYIQREVRRKCAVKSKKGHGWEYRERKNVVRVRVRIIKV